MRLLVEVTTNKSLQLIIHHLKFLIHEYCLDEDFSVLQQKSVYDMYNSVNILSIVSFFLWEFNI